MPTDGLKKASWIFTIISPLATIIAVGLGILVGYLYVEKVAVDKKTMERIEKLLRDSNEELVEMQKILALGLPHYNLEVTFRDKEKSSDERFPEEITLKNGKTATLEIAIHNRNSSEGKAERRADDVSCQVRFPPGFTVSAPWTTGYRKVYRDHTIMTNGGTMVGINYGEDYALHPRTVFLLFVYVTPEIELKPGEKMTFDLDVCADANNPHSKNPACYTKLKINVEY